MSKNEVAWEKKHGGDKIETETKTPRKKRRRNNDKTRNKRKVRNIEFRKATQRVKNSSAVGSNNEDKQLFSLFAETIGDEYGSHDSNSYDSIARAQIHNVMLPQKRKQHIYYQNAGIAWKENSDVQHVIAREKEKAKERIPNQLSLAKEKLINYKDEVRRFNNNM